MKFLDKQAKRGEKGGEDPTPVKHNRCLFLRASALRSQDSFRKINLMVLKHTPREN